jgi:hypothetical protein
MGVPGRATRTTGSVTILGDVPNLLVFDRTCTQIVSTLTLETSTIDEPKTKEVGSVLLVQ